MKTLAQMRSELAKGKDYLVRIPCVTRVRGSFANPVVVTDWKWIVRRGDEDNIFATGATAKEAYDTFCRVWRAEDQEDSWEYYLQFKGGKDSGEGPWADVNSALRFFDAECGTVARVVRKVEATGALLPQTKWLDPQMPVTLQGVTYK